MYDKSSRKSSLISIIIPCYNYGCYLPFTFESLKNQTYKNWECIVIDDGSTDNTRELVKRFSAKDDRIIYIHQTNQGPSAARNTGIRNAKGDFIQLLDADDQIEKRKFEVQLKGFKDFPEAGIIYGDARFFSNDNPEERLFSMWSGNYPWMPKISGTGKEILKALLISNIMVISSPLIRKEVFERCGLFDISLINHEDWEFWIRCAQKNEFFLFLDKPETLALIRFHPQSLSQSRTIMFETNLKVRKRLLTTLRDDELIRINKKYYRLIGTELAISYIKKKKKFIGFLLLVRFSLSLRSLDKFMYGCLSLIFGKTR